MRVAFIDQVGDTAGGAQESLALLLEFLPPTVKVQVILFGDGAYADRLRRRGLDVTIVPVAQAISGATRENPRLTGAFAVGPAAAHIARILRSKRIDVVHTNSVKAHVVGGAAAWMARVPSVAHLRDILHGRGRAIVRTAVGCFSHDRIAIASTVARAYDLRRTVVVANPVDLSRYEHLPARDEARASLGLPIGVPIVAIVGRINRWKGHDRFINAAAEIAAVTPAHFAIVGQARFRDADFVPELRALVTHQGLDKRFSFVDWVDDPISVYASIDINVNCSIREPFGRTAIEAAAAAVPTVCFDDSGVAEFMIPGSGCIKIPAGNVALLAKAIIDLISDNTRLDRAKFQAASWSQQFEASKHAKRVLEILTVTAASGRPRLPGTSRRVV